MTSQSNLPDLPSKERAEYGFARAKDLAFDAVYALWRRRQKEGMKQIDLAQAIGRQPATVSRNLRGPGNWTLRTLGEYVEALNGELEITVHAVEDALGTPSNYHAYVDYGQTSIEPHTTPPTSKDGDTLVTTVSS